VRSCQSGKELRAAMPDMPPAAKEWSHRHLSLAVRSAGVALWSWNIDSDHFTMDNRAFQLWDLPPSDYVIFEDLSSKLHPADRDRVREAFAATRATPGPYDMDFRIIAGDEVRWISARGEGDESDNKGRTMFGVFFDITRRKQAEESNELLAGEMSHRVKNLLSIAAGLTAITSRSVSTANEMAKELTSRLSALGRAHDLVRPVPGGKDNGALLGDLLTILLAPYNDVAPFSGRIQVSVPRMAVGEGGATALAMVVHELATNAVKYGSLSVEAGKLDVTAAIEGDQVVVVWIERGGPPVVAPVEANGFGSGLMTRKMTQQLNGSVEYDWAEEGVTVTLHMDRARLEV
jgi:two-component sensor histidine kinase